MILRRALPLALAALAACAGPDPRLYTLAAIPPATTPAARPGAVIALRRVEIPGYADRAEIARAEPGYRISLAANQRWAEPLSDMIGLVLIQDLTTRLPGALVYAESGPLTATPTATVEAAITSIATTADKLTLTATLEIRPATPNATPATRTLTLTAPLPDPSTATYAEAISTTLATLADTIAAALPR